ncbi:MAG: hypothetical protein ACRDSN_18055, partial [Pseudonocardiaceae bacterium]
MVAVCLVVAIDAALGSRATLVELLLIGPVIAALGASARDTTIVAVFAVLVSIPLGLVGDGFASDEHVVGVIAVAVVGALTVAIARLRATRERNAARLAVQYGVVRVLGEADSLETSAPRLLAAIGEPLGGEVGHLWEADAGDTLRSVG